MPPLSLRKNNISSTNILKSTNHIKTKFTSSNCLPLLVKNSMQHTSDLIHIQNRHSKIFKKSYNSYKKRLKTRIIKFNSDSINADSVSYSESQQTIDNNNNTSKNTNFLKIQTNLKQEEIKVEKESSLLDLFTKKEITTQLKSGQINNNETKRGVCLKPTKIIEFNNYLFYAQEPRRSKLNAMNSLQSFKNTNLANSSYKSTPLIAAPLVPDSNLNRNDDDSENKPQRQIIILKNSNSNQRKRRKTLNEKTNLNQTYQSSQSPQLPQQLQEEDGKKKKKRRSLKPTRNPTIFDSIFMDDDNDESNSNSMSSSLYSTSESTSTCISTKAFNFSNSDSIKSTYLEDLASTKKTKVIKNKRKLTIDANSLLPKKTNSNQTTNQTPNQTELENQLKTNFELEPIKSTQKVDLLPNNQSSQSDSILDIISVSSLNLKLKCYKPLNSTQKVNKDYQVEVPNWRTLLLNKSFKMEGTENMSNEAYEKRHQKLEQEEIKIKKWDIRRQREEYERQKLSKGRQSIASLSSSLTTIKTKLNEKTKNKLKQNLTSNLTQPNDSFVVSSDLTEESLIFNSEFNDLFAIEVLKDDLNLNDKDEEELKQNNKKSLIENTVHKNDQEKQISKKCLKRKASDLNNQSKNCESEQNFLIKKMKISSPQKKIDDKYKFIEKSTSKSFQVNKLKKKSTSINSIESSNNISVYDDLDFDYKLNKTFSGSCEQPSNLYTRKIRRSESAIDLRKKKFKFFNKHNFKCTKQTS